MAVAVIMDFAGATLDQYDEVMRRMDLDADQPSPTGALFHWVAATDTGLRVTDVWESREQFDDARFSKPFSYGFGMGYQFNNFLRTDLTTDFFNSSFDADSSIGRACPGENAGTGCDFTHDSGYNAISVMANGYVDLGTYAGFTPYIGAGVGATNVQWDDLKTRATCVDGAGVCGDTSQGDPVRNPGEESWRFTYALMAGASYDLTNRVKLDIGYRYSDIDGGKMFGYNDADASFTGPCRAPRGR